MTREPGKKKSFRVSAKRLLLTYSQVPFAMTEDLLLYHLQQQLDVKEYIIRTEHDEDGNKHFHAVIILSRKGDIRSPARLSVCFEGKSYHCHYTGIRNLSGTVKYVCKSGDYITNMKHLYKGALIPIQELIRDMALAEGPQKALECYDENFPQEAAGGKSLVSMKQHLNLRAELTARQQAISTPFKVDDFQSLPTIEEWWANGCQPTLW